MSSGRAQAIEGILYLLLWTGAVVSIAGAVGHYTHWTTGAGAAGVFVWLELVSRDRRTKGR
jgi:cbb3-type cytochrome oxidase subunit 1